MTVIGVDVGGTAIKSWRDGAPGGTTPTPAADPTGERTADAIAGLAAGATALGLAVPGIVDDPAGICLLSVNLGWRDVPIGALVAARTGVPVAVTQDVRAGAVAERRSGAGRGRAGPMVFAPLGTGLAVAVVDERGAPVGGGWAGEVGQLRIPAGPLAGLRVEEVASAGGLATRFGSGGPGGSLPVARAVEAGDPRAAALWADAVEMIADVLAWTVAVSGARTAVIGGGLASSGEVLLAPLRAALARRIAGFPEVETVAARLGPAAAAAGAAMLAAGRVDAVRR